MDSPRLCVTVTAPTMAELRARRDAVSDADLVELRLDTVRDPDVAGALEGRRLPVIVTCRPLWEGGAFEGTETERLGLLAEAHRRGAEYVDVEWRADATALLKATGGRRVILSTHDFTGVPTDLLARTGAMRSTGAEVIKVAVTAHALSDCLRLMPVTAGAERATVALAMGDFGLPTRILPARFGSAWTYAGERAAPGQIGPARMRNEFGFRRIRPSTSIYGVLGRPIAHSVSPAMHNAAFRHTGIDAVYLPLQAASFADFLTFAEAIRVAGVSVTAPFKIDAFDGADECDAVSRRIQAVNTLKRAGRRWLGGNTDAAGFLAPLERVMRLPGVRATVLGAGGAARSVVVALTSAGARVAVAARHADRAAAICALTAADAAEWPPRPGTWDLLVNATPLGTHPDAGVSPVPASALSGRVVYDLVYNPARTRLLDEAARAGCRTIGGLEMLVAQAQAQFEWWTGVRPGERVMREAAAARLREIGTL
jgi:3-dehydroquinate dehydratase/shikimate dehydrogenase